MERKYRINQSMAFNLQSMIDHIHCIAYNFDEEVQFEPVICCGRTLKNSEDCWDLIHELEELPCYVGQLATGKEYGFLKRIADERNHLRYSACVASGLDQYAGYAFM